MKILHINTKDNGDGAARAAFGLHSGLRALHQDSRMLVAERRTHDPNVMEAVRSRGLSSRLPRIARRLALQLSVSRYASSRPAGAGWFTDDRSEYGSSLVPQLPECDVVNLHLIGGLVDYRDFFRAVPARKPVVWTLHDTNPFTGGCHYHGACRRFNQHCGQCPELGSSGSRDLSRAIWQRKKQSYSFIPEGRLHLVSPSRWLAGAAQQSALLGRFPVSVIPHGLDTSIFSPRDKGMAKELLGIKRDSSVVLFAATDVGTPRKGFKLLAEALALWPAGKPVHLLSVGQGSDFPGLQLPRTSLGFIGDDRILSWVYSAADLYVTPTLDEAWGNTVMESVSCGTPVVGFDTGGVPDMVRDGVSGFLAPKGDVAALREAMLRVLDNPALKVQLAENCRRIAVEEYDVQVQARRYLALYESLLATHPPRARFEDC
jgi:glycosyltransferase involved in cell wall biosynthesis